MNKKKFTVTIGIPVYNEENNIKYLLESLLKQSEKNVFIEKIIVISDASTDKTNEIISSINNPSVQIIVNKIREGQINIQNKIFSLVNSDVVVLFEADTCPKDNMFLEKLLKPLMFNKKLEFLQGNPQPLPPMNFFEKILYAQDASFYKFVKDLGHPEEIFISGGAGRAFSKKVYKNLVWPKNVPEDSFAFFWLKKNNIKMAFRQNAICYYRLPQSLEDYLIKKQKVIAGQITLNKNFSNLLNNQQNSFSKFLLLKVALYFLFTHPILFFSYLLIKLIEKMRIKKEKFSDLWKYPYSTKALFQIKT